MYNNINGSMKRKSGMIKSALCSLGLYSLLSLSTSCSNIMEPMQDFTPNQYPLIESVTWSPSGSVSLGPDTPVTIDVQASDPDGDALTFSFDSEMGSFTSQTGTATASTVTFYPADFLVSSQTVTIKVKVSDPKGYSVSRQYDLGSTKSGPTITMIGQVTQYISSDSQVHYTFSANDSGICRLRIGGALKTSSFYSAGEEATLTVNGADLSGSSQTVEIEMDSLIGDDTYSFILYLDDDPPSSAASPGGTSSRDPIAVTISATDTGSGVATLSYCLSAKNGSCDDPDFSGNGTVVAGNSAVLTVGTSGAGTYILKYRAIDALGNLESDTHKTTYIIKADTDGPAPVTGLFVSQIRATGMVIEYTPPSDQDYTHALIDWESGSASETGFEYSITGLSAETAYTVTVYAVDSHGNQSTASSVTIETPTSKHTELMSVYYIRNEADLKALQGNSLYWDDYCLLVNDVALSGTSTPIGLNPISYFSGYFNGNEKTVSGFTIDNQLSSYQGFFGYINGGSVKRLTLTDLSIKGNSYTGGLAGESINGEIIRCIVSGSVSGAAMYTGGLAGSNTGPVINSVSRCTVTGMEDYTGGLIGQNGGSLNGCSAGEGTNSPVSVSGNEYTGGLVGRNLDGANTTSCHTFCTVSGTKFTGGLIGYNGSGSVSQCMSVGKVNGDVYTGGLIGYNAGSVKLSYAICDVESDSTNGYAYIGGLMGYTREVVSFCYSSGTIEAASGGYVGGLVGGAAYNAIANCYSRCTVKGKTNVGGLAGSTNGSIRNCFSRGDVTGTGNSIGGLVGFANSSGSNEIKNCYSTGVAFCQSSTNYGGLAGQISGSINIQSCYFLSTGNSDNGYGTAKTESEMKDQNTYIGWDFLDEWVNGTDEYWCWLEDNDGYPSLNGG